MQDGRITTRILLLKKRWWKDQDLEEHRLDPCFFLTKLFHSVLFGGNHLLDKVQTLTRAIWVFTFNSVRDYFGTDNILMDGSGDDEDLHREGSGDEEVKIGVQIVEDSDYVLTEYGPGAVEACAVSLEETWDNVVFAVTGGLNDEGVTLDMVMRVELQNNNGREPTLGLRSFLPRLRVARRKHGCTKVSKQLLQHQFI